MYVICTERKKKSNSALEKQKFTDLTDNPLTNEIKRKKQPKLTCH